MLKLFNKIFLVFHCAFLIFMTSNQHLMLMVLKQYITYLLFTGYQAVLEVKHLKRQTATLTSFILCGAATLKPGKSTSLETSYDRFCELVLSVTVPSLDAVREKKTTSSIICADCRSFYFSTYSVQQRKQIVKLFSSFSNLPFPSYSDKPEFSISASLSQPGG